MRIPLLATLGLVIVAPLTHRVSAANPEDLDIPDPAVPAQPVGPTQPAVPVSPTTPVTPTLPTTPVAPTTPAAPPGAGQDTITVPRAEWEQMKRDIAELKRSRGQLAPATPGTPGTPPATGAPGVGQEEPPPVEASGSDVAATQPVQGSNKALFLPDISFVGQGKGLFGTDLRAESRNTLRLSEGEIGIQSFVYPNVKADAFITAGPSENQPFQVEEAYLTFLGFRKGLNIKAGRQHTPFGRSGLLHTHSWLYTRQLLPFNNLVDPESLAGDGIDLSYLVPTHGNTFVHADLGLWHGFGPGMFTTRVGADPFGGEVPNGPGASYSGSFQTGRLWVGKPLNPDTELELGTSYARGYSTLQDTAGTVNSNGLLSLNGLDVSYRHFMPGARRLLLRSEYFLYRPHAGLITNRTTGWYALGNLRYNPMNDIGLLFENSGFPQAAGFHENDLSLIYTHQFTEQFYGRLQGTHGSRPGKSNFSELRFQLTWGVGPHTHNLE